MPIRAAVLMVSWPSAVISCAPVPIEAALTAATLRQMRAQRL